MLMKLYAGLILSIFLLAEMSHAEVQCSSNESSKVSGFISAASGADFTVNGKQVAANAQTVFWERPGAKSGKTVPESTIGGILTLGEGVQVCGNDDRHTHVITAANIYLVPEGMHVKGFAVVQRVLSTSPELTLEADGYTIAVTPQTVVSIKPPLIASAVPSANLWIAYEGNRTANGQVVADQLKWMQFALSGRQKKALAKSKETLVAPKYGLKPGDTGTNGSITALYIDARKHTVVIPANAALQERVKRVGERLIPASQKDLAEDNPQKINFRFFAVDDKRMYWAIGSPDGVVLIPEQMVEALSSDDDLATVLSPAVAEVLERQVPPPAGSATGSTLLVLGGMPFMPPVEGLALMSVGFYEAEHEGYPSRFDPMQCSRVGLSLMHDAGYDIFESPRTWQILRYGSAQRAAGKPDTQQSEYLLSVIGEEYERPEAASSH